MNALKLTDVTKHYKDFSLDRLSLTLPSGCIMGLVGENGAGKSTTIRLIMNAIRRDAGSIEVLGVNNESPEFLDIKEDIGVVLDEAYFPEVMNAAQVGRVMCATYKRWDTSCYAAYLKRFDLPADKEFRSYSRGMKMKLAIAVALSHAPRLLILDEATSGLDPIVRDEILDLFAEFTRDESHSILISSHIISDLEKICDYVAFLHKGKLRFCEEKDRLSEEYALVSCGHSALAALPAGAVLGVQESQYGARALVRRAQLPVGMEAERAGIEDIILFIVKGETRK